MAVLVNENLLHSRWLHCFPVCTSAKLALSIMV